MRDMNNFKHMLGPCAEKYTPAQLDDLQQQMYAMTDLLLDIYLARRGHSRDVDADSSRGTMKSERSKNELPLG